MQKPRGGMTIGLLAGVLILLAWSPAALGAQLTHVDNESHNSQFVLTGADSDVDVGIDVFLCDDAALDDTTFAYDSISSLGGGEFLIEVENATAVNVECVLGADSNATGTLTFTEIKLTNAESSDDISIDPDTTSGDPVDPTVTLENTAENGGSGTIFPPNILLKDLSLIRGTGYEITYTISSP